MSPLDEVGRFLSPAPGALTRPSTRKRARPPAPTFPPNSSRPPTTEPVVSDLYNYQADGVRYLRAHDRCLFADDMGLGKTVQALRALEKNDRALILCPAGLCLTWLAEAKKWRSDLAARVWKASANASLVPDTGELVIASYDSLPAPSLVSMGFGNVAVIMDECHKVKNSAALRTRAASALAVRAARVWMLTGTPMLGKPLDLFGVLKTGGLVGRSFGSFDKFVTVFGGTRNKWGAWEFGERKRGKKREVSPEQMAVANACLSKVMLRRLKTDVLPELPKKTYTSIPVSIAGSHVIDHADKRWEVYGADELPPFEMISEARRVLASAKIPAMIEEVDSFEENDTPLLVFSSHREPIDVLADRKGWGVITGEVTQSQRKRLVDKFQAGELLGLGLTIGAGGIGLTLTRASNVLFVDRDYTPAANLQAEDRVVRIGQEARGVVIRSLTADHPLDKRLHEILFYKQRLIMGVVG